MKHLLTLSFSICMLGLYAQDTTAVSSEAKQQFLVQRLTEELNLTQEQQASVRELIHERSKQITQAKSPTMEIFLS